jgi:hypothetical protein
VGVVVNEYGDVYEDVAAVLVLVLVPYIDRGRLRTVPADDTGVYGACCDETEDPSEVVDEPVRSGTRPSVVVERRVRGRYVGAGSRGVRDGDPFPVGVVVVEVVPGITEEVYDLGGKKRRVPVADAGVGVVWVFPYNDLVGDDGLSSKLPTLAGEGVLIGVENVCRLRRGGVR